MAVKTLLRTSTIKTAIVKNNDGREKVCPGFFSHGVCKNGHEWIKLVVCGKEWCPVCGQKGSIYHKRRISRWLPKAQQLKRMGYLVFTIPEDIRKRFTSKAALSALMIAVKNILIAEGYERGLMRYHWFGDESEVYHPHINAAIDAGRLSHSKIRHIKRAYSKVLGVDVSVVNYSYKRSPAQMYQAIEYITRPTFTNYDWSPKMAKELRNFRNTRVWGKSKTDENGLGRWVDSAGVYLKEQWRLHDGEEGFLELDKLERGVCPICGERICWTHKALPINILRMKDFRAVEYSPGYYSLE